MHGLLASLSLMASAAAGVLAADLKIDVTLPVECDRRTQANDKIYVHYRGTLQSNGNKFDASYDRGTPFSFVLGQGQVIKGYDNLPSTHTDGVSHPLLYTHAHVANLWHVVSLPQLGARSSRHVHRREAVTPSLNPPALRLCLLPKTLTVPPEYGYGQRGIGPIPAGSTLVFETELIGIEGVPKPESIVTKAATGDPSADSSASTEAEAEAETPNVAEKIASKVAEAADVVKTIVADTDDSQEHNEL
ncbi:FK506-binding protein 2 [Sporothrix schenckii 1099-18]|uniref:peptidylprolyl isomerase n=1 Tax=Sporothrix schenckii 1099-18 TaxID=1397361 RepID=A0A0F2M0P9_SPOSC|nr:FK506-binding protein 2 [Sporothrix schenckii 1099-18]KJR82649.1 FK506-binding protein 2 [Sporothrix schenckii 1099-18]